MNIQKFVNFKLNEKFNFENHKAFKNKLKEFISDDGIIDKILNLIPSDIILPEYYINEKIKLIDEDKIVKVTEISYKNHTYIYYYINEDGDEVYGYEDEFERLIE